MTLNDCEGLSVGISTVRAVAAQAILRRRFSACSIGMVRKDARMVANFGTHAYPDLGYPHVATHNGSRFDIASITKSIPVALLTLWAVTEGLLTLDTPVLKFFPDMKCNTFESPTIHDLLAYRAWLETAWLQKPYSQFSPSELYKALTKTNISLTRSQFHYGNQAPMLLGFILEQVTKMCLEELAQHVLFDLLGMKDTTFWPEAGDDKNYVYTEGDKPGVVHDEITRAIARPSGASGVFSTSSDLLLPLRLLLNKGAWEGKQLIREDLIAQIGVNQLGSGTMFGLGFGVWEQFLKGFEEMPKSVRKYVEEKTRGAYFKLGYTGTMCAVFPELDTGIVILTNTVHPTREGSSLKINQLRYILCMLLLTNEFPLGADGWWRDTREQGDE